MINRALLVFIFGVLFEHNFSLYSKSFALYSMLTYAAIFIILCIFLIDILKRISKINLWLNGKILSKILFFCSLLYISLPDFFICELSLNSHLDFKNNSISVACSVLAASIVYFLYEQYAKPQEINKIVEETSNTAVDEVRRLYQRKFIETLPQESYISDGPQDQPEESYMKRTARSTNLDSDFEKLFADSNRYWTKTTSGIRASKRLLEYFQDNNRQHSCNDVRFLLLDPKNDNLLRRRCEADDGTTRDKSNSANTSISIDKKIETKKVEILTTLIYLYACCQLHKIPIQIGIYDEFTCYRFEILAGGLFLTFYERVREYDSYDTFKFDKEAFIYPPLEDDFLQTYSYSREKHIFDASTSISDLIETLRNLTGSDDSFITRIFDDLNKKNTDSYIKSIAEKAINELKSKNLQEEISTIEG